MLRLGALVVVALLVALPACEKKSRSASGSAGATPALRDGDIVFHESTSKQSEMVRVLTRSRWTHMGVVFEDASGPVVLEAVSPVRYTPLATWIARGREKEYAAKRLRDADLRLGPEVVRKMRRTARSWLGRPYDLRFRWSDDAFYCSELVYKLFERAAGVRIGKVQRAKEMNLDDQRVKAAQTARFGKAPFDPEESVVTPGSMFEDEQLVTVEELEK